MSAKRFNDLVEMQRTSVTEHGNRPLFGSKRDGVWSWMTYAEFGRQVDDARGGLAAAGVGPDDAVAIISSNRVEWAVLAYATYGLGARIVPMYEHQLAKEWEFILNDSAAKLLIASTESIFEQVKDWPSSVKALEKVFGMELAESDERSFAHLRSVGRAKPAPVAKLSADTICGFIYTSGTTGQPKGVLLSHGNIVSNVNGVHAIFPLSPSDRTLSFLPWAHSLGQTVDLHVTLSMGCSIALAESVEKLVDNFAEVKPTILVSVPRIWNKIYDGLNKKMEEAGGLKKKMFDAALANEGKRRKLESKGKSSFWVNGKAKLFDKLVFSKVRARLGGRLKYAVSGGAALSPEVAEFIDRVGITVCEGYGLTETSPIVTANYPGMRKIGSVGVVIPEVRVEIDKSVLDDPASSDGEIVVFGPNVMKGYHNLPEETAAVTTKDGGFRTGDRGRIDDEGFLYITGRIKEQYKLENGKYVVPAPLEEQLQLSPFILQVFVDGANKPYNAAIVVPDKAAVSKWAAEKGLSGDYSTLLQNQELKKLIAAELERYSAEFKGYERIREFTLVGEEFSTQNGMLTPSLKLKRRIVLEKHGDLLRSLWPQ